MLGVPPSIPAAPNSAINRTHSTSTSKPTRFARSVDENPTLVAHRSLLLRQGVACPCNSRYVSYGCYNSSTKPTYKLPQMRLGAIGIAVNCDLGKCDSQGSGLAGMTTGGGKAWSTGSTGRQGNCGVLNVTPGSRCIKLLSGPPQDSN